ncbi:gamma carbonic anhydrase family protein [Candidatus Chlorohelix sp.]|uniref:gamma carbonic anhydrase family protein n=1 Tax=Candidatus Chlorohelix sp. TaxID=3139201 RepID=UPI0030319969
MWLIEYNGNRPQIGENVFIAPNATLIGDVVIENGASIWFGVVLRADNNRIIIGENANVQDNTVVHTNDDDPPTTIGACVTIGHSAVLEGCIIEKNAVIGMNATVLSKAVVGEGAMVAANSVVTIGSKIPAWNLAAGIPAQVKKELSGQSRKQVEENWKEYTHLRDAYLAKGIDRIS